MIRTFQIFHYVVGKIRTAKKIPRTTKNFILQKKLQAKNISLKLLFFYLNNGTCAKQFFSQNPNLATELTRQLRILGLNRRKMALLKLYLRLCKAPRLIFAGCLRVNVRRALRYFDPSRARFEG